MNWIKIESDTEIPTGIELLLFNEKWIDEDFNPNGVRIGFKDDLTNWTTAQYSNYQDCYYTRTADEDDNKFKLSKAVDQIPTHFKVIDSPLKKKHII